MLHVHVAQLVAPGAQPPGHRSERFRQKVRRLKPFKPSKSCERSYLTDLRVVVRAVKLVANSRLLPALRAEFPGKLVSDAATPRRVQEIVGDVAKVFGGIDKQAKHMADLAAKRTLGAVDERLARSMRDSISVNIEPYLTRDGRIGKVLLEKTTENVELIKTIPHQFFYGSRHFEMVDGKQVEKGEFGVVDLVAKNWREGGRWESLVEDIQKLGGVTERRAEVIARDQTAKLNAAFNQIRCTDVGIDEYEWSCSDDERTRVTHWRLNGTRHSWHDEGPLEGTIDGEPCHPGEDIECRCNAVPFIDLTALEKSLGLAPMREDA